MERWIKEIETLRFDRLFVYLGLVLPQRLYSCTLQKYDFYEITKTSTNFT